MIENIMREMMVRAESALHQAVQDLVQQPSPCLEKLPLKTWSTQMAKEMKWSNQDECGICLSSYQDREVLVELPCEHFYHQNCLLPWLKQSPQCPSCRHQLPVEPVSEPEDELEPQDSLAQVLESAAEETQLDQQMEQDAAAFMNDTP